MKRTILSHAIVLASATLAACGGSMSPTVSNGVPVTLTVGDAPPNGVAVLFFEASITGANLQPSDSSKPPISVLTSPVEVEFGHLHTDTAFLSLAKVTPDTYNSMTLTFGNAQLTIINHSGAAIGSCANNAVCELTPNFATSTVMLSGAPFPMTINMNSVVGIKLDLNVNSSVQDDLSIKPSVTIAHVHQRDDADEKQEMEDLDDVHGQITAVGDNQFTLTNRRSGQSFTVNVDSNTVYQEFDRAGCTANPQNFTCVKMDQIVEVRLSENGMGTLLAKRVEFVENASQLAIKGTITSADSSTQFHMVVFLEEPPVSGITEGAPVAVNIAPDAVFQVGREEMGEFGGFSAFGFSFSSSSDLMVGQDVQVHQGTVTSNNGTITLTTDLVRLWPSQISGQVGSINPGSNTFTLTGLSPLFTGATPPVTSITVLMLSDMEFEDSSNNNSPKVGDSMSVKGLLFNTPNTPTLVTRMIRHRED